MGKEINAILGAQTILIWTYDIDTTIMWALTTMVMYLKLQNKQFSHLSFELNWVFALFVVLCMTPFHGRNNKFVQQRDTR